MTLSGFSMTYTAYSIRLQEQKALKFINYNVKYRNPAVPEYIIIIKEVYMAEVLSKLKKCIAVANGRVEIKDAGAVKGITDELIYEAVFDSDEGKRNALQRLVIEIAKRMGAVPASIQSLYEEMGRNYPGFTVPAINIRGLTYDVARVIFRKAIEKNVGAFIFEIARSDIGYTKQRPIEYTAVVLAAAVREGFRSTAFILWD